jgi:hypothetical protein
MAFGGLRDFMAQDRSIFARGLMTLSLGLVALMAALWALKRKQGLFVCVVFTNALFTCALLLHMSGPGRRAVRIRLGGREYADDRRRADGGD